MPDHTVQQGDCISSIAQQHGFFWQTLWDHPNNASLRAARQCPNVLMPGDVVHIPEREEKQEAGVTEKRHPFRKKGTPAKFRIQIMVNDVPRANERYTLEIDGQTFQGTTDADGRLNRSIPPDARSGRLVVGLPPNQDEFPLNLGSIDPVDQVTGTQQRLRNMGYYAGEIDGEMGPDIEAALRLFQQKRGLPVTGQLDGATRARLQEIHGS